MSTSSGVFTRKALPSAISLFVPCDRWSSTEPGIAKTGRASNTSVTAWRRDSAPERAPAAITTTARESAAMMRLRIGKCPLVGGASAGSSLIERAALADPRGEPGVLRIDPREPVPQDRDRPALGRSERALVGRAVDPLGEAAHDDDPLGRERARELVGEAHRAVARLARADDRDRARPRVGGPPSDMSTTGG